MPTGWAEPLAGSVEIAAANVAYCPAASQGQVAYLGAAEVKRSYQQADVRPSSVEAASQR